MNEIEKERQRCQEDNVVLRRLLWWLLRLVERWLLLAYGWTRTEEALLTSSKAWVSPESHPKAGDRYDHDHAINSMKYYERERSPQGVMSPYRVVGRKSRRFAA